jgi:t-SNARE complex subunit (syntaxin)
MGHLEQKHLILYIIIIIIIIIIISFKGNQMHAAESYWKS